MSRSDRFASRAVDDARNNLAGGTDAPFSGADSESPTSSPHRGRRPDRAWPSDRGRRATTGPGPVGTEPATGRSETDGPHDRTGRPSVRAEEYAGTSHLPPPIPSPANGADGGHRRGRRVGRRQLAHLRQQLADRDLAILHSVAALHFVTTRQLERLHFHHGHTTPLAAARACRHVLARLHDLGLVDRLDRRIGGVRAGSASFVYALSRSGSRLLGDSNRRRSREPSLAHLSHVLDVAELVVRLHERARDGNVELLGVETEPACWRPFVGPHGAQVWLKPDLRLTLGVGEHELHWFVEVDRGTEHRAALTRKLKVYLAAWRDGGEQARAGVFPRVLWVAPDDERARALTRAWRSVGGVPDGMFTATATDAAVAILTSPPGGGRR